MKENRKLIQIILIFTGLFLIIATYFYYPKINENKLRGSVIQDKPTDITDGANKDNTFENVEYKGLYDFDKPFIIISEKAYILSENPNIIYISGNGGILIDGASPTIDNCKISDNIAIGGVGGGIKIVGLGEDGDDVFPEIKNM